MTSEYIDKISNEFAQYTLKFRAIPSLVDGLKVVQRIALWVIRNDTGYAKVSEVVGSMMRAKLYVHGDASAGEAVSKLAGPYINNIPLLDGKGAFGTRVSPVDSIGAPRYVSVKKSSAMEKFLLVDLDIVPHEPNFDGSTTMPEYFLPVIPLILLNGVHGIATGWATHILPRKLEDIIDATLAAIDGKPIKSLLPHWERYDETVTQIGPRQYAITGKFTRLNSSKIVVTELPHTITHDMFVEILEDIIEPSKEKENYISPIKEYVDECADSIKFEIRFSRGLLDSFSDEDIIKLLRLRDTESENLVCISWTGKPVVYKTAEELIVDFVEYRFGWYKKRYEQLIEQETKLLSYLGSLNLCYEAKISRDIQSMKNKAVVIDRIKAVISSDFEPDIENMNRIAELPSYKWTDEGHQECLDKIEQCMKRIDEYEEILADPKKQRNIFKNEVSQLRKVK